MRAAWQSTRIDGLGAHGLRTCDLLLAGGGFAAIVAALCAARRAPAGFSLHVCAEGDRPVGRGLAYDDTDPLHLLNAAAARMSADPDDEARFWRACGLDPCAFAPRPVYGQWLSTLWDEAASTAAARGVDLRLARCRLVSAEPAAGNLVCRPEAGAPFAARALLVCEGPRPPAPLLPDGPRWIGRPWPLGIRRAAFAPGRIVIVGSGLTAIDAALSALAAGPDRHVTMVSSDGRLPLAHAGDRRAAEAGACVAMEGPPNGGPLDVLRRVRAECAAAGDGWRGVIDALRAHADTVWRRWTPDERRAALRHLQRVWTRARHRAPAATLARLDAARDEGRLDMRAAHVTHAGITPDGVVLTTREGTVRADQGVDARGPSPARAGDGSLAGHLLATGLARPSPLGWGVRADANGLASLPGAPPVWCVGACRMGDLVESTGAPEVRAQTVRAVANAIELLSG